MTEDLETRRITDETLPSKEDLSGVTAFKRSREVVIGGQTKEVLARMFPDLSTEQIENQHLEKISVFSVVERTPAPKEPTATLGIPGIAFGYDAFMRQEEPLAQFGAFVGCDYPVGPLNYELWLAQVNDVFEEQKKAGRRIVLMGNSMGGTLATVIAKQHPDIEGLILIYAPGSPRELSETRLKHLYKVAEGVAARENGWLAQSAAAVYTRFFNRSLSGIPDNFPLEFRERFKQGIKLTPEAVRTRALATIRAIEEVREYRAPVSSVPTLMIGSQKDRFLPSFSPHLQNLFPNFTTVFVPALHGDMLKQPETINQAMINWLKKTFNFNPQDQ